MSDSRQVRSLAEQIQDALWLCVSPKRNALDDEMLELRDHMKKIIRDRDLNKFKAVLALMGKGEDTEEGQKLIEEFKKILGLND